MTIVSRGEYDSWWHVALVAGARGRPPSRTEIRPQWIRSSEIYDLSLSNRGIYRPPSGVGVHLCSQAHRRPGARAPGTPTAVSIGNDTVAAIAGGLLSARNGASALPREWVRDVHDWPGMRAADLESLALAIARIPAD